MPELWGQLFRGGAGHGESFNLSPQVTVKLSSRFTLGLAFDWSESDRGYQWWGNVTDRKYALGVMRYTSFTPELRQSLKSA